MDTAPQRGAQLCRIAYIADDHRNERTAYAVGYSTELGEHMAQRVQVLLEDDIDGSTASETVTFGLDGVTYEIDLNEDNATALRDALAAYVGAGRRAGGRRSTGRRKSSGSSSSSGTSEIREWARANGYEVSERGRISADVKDAYEKATS